MNTFGHPVYLHATFKGSLCKGSLINKYSYILILLFFLMFKTFGTILTIFQGPPSGSIPKLARDYLSRRNAVGCVSQLARENASSSMKDSKLPYYLRRGRKTLIRRLLLLLLRRILGI